MDPFKKIRRMFDTWNAWSRLTFTPGYLVNGDESMIRWLSKYGLPGLMFVKENPTHLATN